jgi:hypothetical protein
MHTHTHAETETRVTKYAQTQHCSSLAGLAATADSGFNGLMSQACT